MNEWMNEWMNMVVKCSDEWFAVVNAVVMGSTLTSASNWARFTCIKVSMTRRWVCVRDWCSYPASVMMMIYSYHCLTSLLLLLLRLIAALIRGDVWLVCFISVTLYYAIYVILIYLVQCLWWQIYWESSPSLSKECGTAPSGCWPLDQPNWLSKCVQSVCFLLGSMSNFAMNLCSICSRS